MICHRIAILKNGRTILEGSLSEIVEPLKANNRNLEDFFVSVITEDETTRCITREKERHTEVTNQ